MGFSVDTKEIDKVKKILHEKILANKFIPEETKFGCAFNLDLDPKTKISDRQIEVADKLKSGYYQDRQKELQKDLDAIDRKLNWAPFTGVDLSGLDLHGVDFSPCRLNNANLKNCNLSNARLVFVDAQGADFSNAKLDGANCSMIKASDARFIGCSATGANFSLSDLGRSNFSGASLSMVNMKSSDIIRCNFVGANLTGADLSMSFLDYSDFSGAILTGVSVEESSIVGTIFELKEAQMRGQGIRYGEGRNRGGYGGERSVGGYVDRVSSIYNSKSSQYTKKGRYGGGE